MKKKTSKSQPEKFGIVPNLLLEIMCQHPLTDQKTITNVRRLIAHDQLRFLTVEFPKYGKLLDQGLTLGRLPHLCGIAKSKGKTRLPVLFYEFFSVIFHDNGYLRDEFDVRVLRFLRTILYFAYKLEVPFTDNQLNEACKKFVDLDDSVKTTFDDRLIRAIMPTFLELIPDDILDIIGRHSNGATATEGIDNVSKRLLCRIGPVHEVLGLSPFYLDALSASSAFHTSRLVKGSPVRSRVTFVPKDSRGPRTICMEPHEAMFIQQGLMHRLYWHIENVSPAKGRINFTDQSINQSLAYRGSIDGSYATLDLKDASDLVSWSLVKGLLVNRPELLALIEAVRSPEAVLPDGTTKVLKKFAPMGSALCFPIEAMVFYSIVRLITDQVWVYGDDIIVPTEHATHVIGALQAYGLNVNIEKSLFRGRFRESCGGDYFRGYDITPVRCRKTGLDSCVELINQLADKFEDTLLPNGLTLGERIARACYDVLVSYQGLCVPLLPRRYKDTGVLAVFGPWDNSILFKRKFDKNYQCNSFRFLTVKSTSKRCLSTGKPDGRHGENVNVDGQYDDCLYFETLSRHYNANSFSELCALRECARLERHNTWVARGGSYHLDERPEPILVQGRIKKRLGFTWVPEKAV